MVFPVDRRRRRGVFVAGSFSASIAAGVFLSCFVAGVAGCAGSQLAVGVVDVRYKAKEARDNGAMRCAPRQLAMADTNVEFAARELDEGDYYRAREHLQIAEDNAREALRLSPRDKCVGPPKPTDRDGDGISDDVDKCPNDPEDKDGFEDADGCPDPDNDKDGIADVADKCPNDAGGQGRLRGRRRLPRSRQRQGRHRRRGRQVSERPRGQGRVRGRRRLPRSRQRQGRQSPTPTTSVRTTRARPTTPAAPRSTNTSSSPGRKSSSSRRSSSRPTRP